MSFNIKLIREGRRKLECHDESDESRKGFALRNVRPANSRLTRSLFLSRTVKWCMRWNRITRTERVNVAPMHCTLINIIVKLPRTEVEKQSQAGESAGGILESANGCHRACGFTGPSRLFKVHDRALHSLSTFTTRVCVSERRSDISARFSRLNEIPSRAAAAMRLCAACAIIYSPRHQVSLVGRRNTLAPRITRIIGPATK